MFHISICFSCHFIAVIAALAFKDFSLIFSSFPFLKGQDL